MSMQLNPSEISDLIKSRIQNLQLAATSRNEGTVVSVTDGITRIRRQLPAGAKGFFRSTGPSRCC